MPRLEHIKTEVLIIGSGIAGLCMALEAEKRGLKYILLDDGYKGTTHSATGIFDARIDHLPDDEESVRITSEEIGAWKMRLPSLVEAITPRHFLMPISNRLPHSPRLFEMLFKRYEDIASARFDHIPGQSTIINNTRLEKLEPNLRKNYFDGAFSMWLWTVCPEVLIRELRKSIRNKIWAKEITAMELDGHKITKVVINGFNKNDIEIQGLNGKLLILNLSGPWINTVTGSVGIALPLSYKLGLQASTNKQMFNSNLINFASDGKYLIYLQYGDQLQIGPTNTPYEGDLRKIGDREEDLEYLRREANETIDGQISPTEIRLSKSGFRVNPGFIVETDRPVIWHHANQGFDNFYSALPGKMVLGLLLSRELAQTMEINGHISHLSQDRVTNLCLEGHNLEYTNARLLAIKTKSLINLGCHITKSVFS